MNYTELTDYELAGNLSEIMQEVINRGLLTESYIKSARGIMHRVMQVSKDNLLEKMLAEEKSQ